METCVANSGVSFRPVRADTIRYDIGSLFLSVSSHKSQIIPYHYDPSLVHETRRQWP